MKWINVKDELPKPNVRQRLMIIDSDTNEHQKAHFSKGKFYHFWDFANHYPIKDKVVWWLVLPEPK